MGSNKDKDTHVTRHKSPWKILKNAFERDIKPRNYGKEYYRRPGAKGGEGREEEEEQGDGAQKVLDRVITSNVFVKIVSADGVLASDTNNLSDPVRWVLGKGSCDSTSRRTCGGGGDALNAASTSTVESAETDADADSLCVVCDCHVWRRYRKHQSG